MRKDIRYYFCLNQKMENKDVVSHAVKMWNKKGAKALLRPASHIENIQIYIIKDLSVQNLHKSSNLKSRLSDVTKNNQ